MRHATNRQKTAYVARELFRTFKGWLVAVAVVSTIVCLMCSVWVGAEWYNRVPGPHVSGVETDTAIVARLMPELGPVAEAHWRWRDEWSTYGGGRGRGPKFLRKRQDVTFEGFALLSRERVAALFASHPGGGPVIWWNPAGAEPNSNRPPPPIPGPLARFGPTAPSWLISWNFPDEPRSGSTRRAGWPSSCTSGGAPGTGCPATPDRSNDNLLPERPDHSGWPGRPRRASWAPMAATVVSSSSV
jgi:hypothetical protein